MKPTKPLKWHLSNWQVLELTLVDDREFCHELNINRKTSFNYRSKGLLPHLRIGGRIYYRLTDVLVFVERRKSGKKLEHRT